MPAIARWCFRHRFAVITAWVLVLIGLGILAQAVKTQYNNSFALPGTGSTTAQELLAKTVPVQSGDADTIVWHVSTGTVRAPAIMARMTPVLDRIARFPEVAAVISPYGPRGAAQISRDGRTAYATADTTGVIDNTPAAYSGAGSGAASTGQTFICLRAGGIIAVGAGGGFPGNVAGSTTSPGWNT